MTQLATQISNAIDVEMAGVREQLDAELSSRAIVLHYGAITVPSNGQPDRRTEGMLRYARLLSRDSVNPAHLDDAVARMFKDSLAPDFLEWVGKFCAAHSRISEDEVAARLTEFMNFTGLRSVTSTEDESDKLLDAEEAERVRHDEALARCRQSVARAKAKLSESQSAYDKAVKRRVRASQLTDVIDRITLEVPDSFRQCVLAAQTRHLKRLAHPTRKKRKVDKGTVRNDGAETSAPATDEGSNKTDLEGGSADNPALGLTAAEAAKAAEQVGKKAAPQSKNNGEKP